LEPLHIFLLIAVGFGASFVQRVSGFGLGIFAMMFLPHFLPSHTAAATISSLFCCGTATYNAIRYRKNIAFKTVLPMMIAAAISIPVAVYFSAKVSGAVFEVLLGVALILLSVYFLFFNKRVALRPTVVNGVVAGTLGGTLGGLFSTGGPPAVLYLTHATTDNMVYFATIQFYFCFTNWYATANRVLNGVVTWQLLVYAVIGIVGCMAGDFVGRRVFNKLDGAKLKTVIYTGMIVSGILMIL